jgi:hypothetical protein
MYKNQGSKVAFGIESTYGTAVSTTVSARVESVSLDDTREDVRPLLLDTQATESESVQIRSGGSGDIRMPAAYINGALPTLAYLALGANATTGSGPYTHTATPDKDLPSATIEVLRGDSTKSQIFPGMKCNTFDLSVDARGLGSIATSWMGQDSAGRDTPGTFPAFAAAPTRIIGQHGGQLSFNGVDYTIQSLTFRVDNKLSPVEEYGSDSPSEMLIPGAREIVATVKLIERGDVLHTAFRAGTTAAFSLAFTSSPRSLTISGSTVKVDSYSAPLEGKGPIEASVTFRFLEPIGGASPAVSFAVVNANATYGGS